MNQYNKPRASIIRARQENRCITAPGNTETQAMVRRRHSQQLIRVHHGVYAEPEVWRTLDLTEQSLYICKALALQHPNWVFAGLSAAAIHHLPHRSWMHHSRQIYIAAKPGSVTNPKRKIQHICMPACTPTLIGDLKVTSIERTLIDCTLRYDFRDALAMFDFALRNRLTTKEAVAEAVHGSDEQTTYKQAELHRLAILAHYASPLSESFGESLCRGTMISEGFPEPHLQVEHHGILPDGDSYTYRTDFEYVCPNGATIIVEFDGAQKYVDPEMTDGQTIRAVVGAEQLRERTLRAEPRVSRIIRFNYDQVIQRNPVIQALTNAGIPRRITDDSFPDM